MVGRSTQARTRSVGRYELLLELGKSPLGSLWLGKSTGDGETELRMLRRVQLTRELSPEDRDLLSDAARWSLEVSGDCVVKNRDVVVEKGELAIASDQNPGETLRSLLRLSNFKRQAIPSSIATRICLDVCRGLESALEHAALSPRGPNFVSGGLLPDSILVGTDGRTRLLDVGVAATWCGIASVAEHPEITAYRAPESLRDEQSIERDARADMFTLGTLLWEMLSGGRRLFLGSSHSGVVQRVLTHPIPPVAGGATTDPPPEGLIALMQRVLERDPSSRFPTLSALTQALLGQGPAEPEAVAQYVNRVAKSALDSRRRVVERALKRSSVRPAVAQPRKAGAAATAPRAPLTPAGALAPSVGTTAATPTAQRAAPVAQRTPATTRDASFAPPPLAKPLPLPAQAKLGVTSTGKSHVPPPPPEASSSPETEPVREIDRGSSVRAADIMRALAVEDAPDSEQASTVRNPNANEDARAAERALSETPPPQAGPETPAAPATDELSAMPQPTITTPQRWQPRPKQDTSVGLGPDIAPPPTGTPSAEVAQAAPEAAVTTPEPIASEPSAASVRVFNDEPPSDRLTTTRALASSTAAEAPEIPAAPPVPKLEPDGKARDAAAKPATKASKRMPVAVLAGAAAAAFLLVLGLVFALGGGEEEVQTKAAVPEREAAEQKQAKASKPAEEQAGAEPTPKPSEEKPEASEEDETDSADDEKQAADDETKPDEQDEEQTKAEAEAKAAPAPAAPKPIARPRVAPKPRARPVQRKRKAKRSFIPSGI